MFNEHISTEVILFFILYGITGVVPLMASVYLLLRRGNAFAPEVTPPVRLRRWTVAFFAVAALGHVWWYLFFILCGDINSVCYVVVVILDCIALLTTIAGTLLAMLQDRRRPIWPAFAAMVPFSVLGALHIFYPDGPFMDIAAVYILALYVLFSVYMVFAVRTYGRWLNDNYADLENKKVWLSQVVSFFCLLLFILYALVDTESILIYVLHIVELVLFGLLLWRVETLPSLTTEMGDGSECTQDCNSTDELSISLSTREGQGGGTATIDLEQIERLLKEHCVDKQLYLQHDLSLQQLAQVVGTNRFYLSQYFSRHSITYNTYINNLRINHFINCYEEAVAARQPVSAKQLAHESGFRSYRTFSRAFMQRTGHSVTTWIDQSTE